VPGLFLFQHKLAHERREQNDAADREEDASKQVDQNTAHSPASSLEPSADRFADKGYPFCCRKRLPFFCFLHELPFFFARIAIRQFRNADFADKDAPLREALLVAPESAVDRLPAGNGHYRFTPADQFLVLVRQLDGNPLSHRLSRNAVRHLAVRRI
jgi:hypothetical protein